MYHCQKQSVVIMLKVVIAFSSLVSLRTVKQQLLQLPILAARWSHSHSLFQIKKEKERKK